MKFHFRWGQNRETKNKRLEMIVTSFQNLKFRGEKDFSGSFLFSYKPRTLVPFRGEFISSK